MTEPAVLAPPAVRVRVPATSANLGPGFDTLALALGCYDDVVVEVTAAALSVDVHGAGADDVARDERNLLVRSLRAGFDVLGRQPPGLRVRCHNRIPHARGLGSSAAAVCAGLTAARALVPGGAAGLDEAALLRLATELEGHPDNAAACLYGGLTLAWRAADGPRAIQLSPAAGLAAVVFVPSNRSSTTQARAMLPDTIAHRDAAAGAARAALLVSALTGRLDLLLEATEDYLHQPYRAAAIPATTALVAALRADGVAAVVSGAGPSVLALLAGDPDHTAAAVTSPPAPDLARLSAIAGSGWQILALPVATRGARVRAGKTRP